MTARGTGRYPALDGVRGLASLAVVFHHVGFATGRNLDDDLVGPLLSRGNFGVTLFFLLSGFLLYRPFARYSFSVGSRPVLRDYFWRRAARIFPALWLAISVTLVLLSTFRFSWASWASYFFLVQTYNHHDYDSSLGQLWTLGVEVSFYALLPVLARIVGGPRRGPDAVLRRHVAVIAAMVVVTQAFNLAYYHGVITDLQAVLWLPNFLDWFAGGMVLAVLSAVPQETRAFRETRRTIQTWASSGQTCVVLAAVLIGLSLLPLGMPRDFAPGLFWQWTAEHFLFLAAAFFLLLPLVLGSPGRVAAALGSRFGALLGSLSYSIYLWHPQLMQWLQRTFDIKPFTGQFPLLLVLTLATTLPVAAASWYLVEKPILDYTSRRLRGRSTRGTAPIAIAARQSS
jgi:peptidoglycan/LPS O-acetylase OafA/YrhL